MLIYTQLDIPVTLPPEEKLFQFIRTRTLSKNPDIKKGVINIVGAMGEIPDWRASGTSNGSILCDEDTIDICQSLQDIQVDAATNYNIFLENKPFNWNPEFEEWFPELKEAALAMPFSRLAMVALLFSAPDGEYVHNDPNHFTNAQLPFNPPEPSRFNIKLTPSSADMYAKTPEGNTYFKVTTDYPAFAFNNKDFKHAGEDSEDGTIRVQLIVKGELDEERHSELIARSVAKFSNHAYYNNGTH